MTTTYSIEIIDSATPPSWGCDAVIADVTSPDAVMRHGSEVSRCRMTVTTTEPDELEAALEADDAVLEYSVIDGPGGRSSQLARLSAHAVDSVTRAIMADGIDLSHAEADELGEETLDWMRARLGLTITETDAGVEAVRS